MNGVPIFGPEDGPGGDAVAGHEGRMKKTGNISGLGYAMATLALVALTIIMQTLTAPTGIRMRKLIKHGGITVLTLLERFQSIHPLLGSPSMDIQSMDSWVGMKRVMYLK